MAKVDVIKTRPSVTITLDNKEAYLLYVLLLQTGNTSLDPLYEQMSKVFHDLEPKFHRDYFVNNASGGIVFKEDLIDKELERHYGESN